MLRGDSYHSLTERYPPQSIETILTLPRFLFMERHDGVLRKESKTRLGEERPWAAAE